MPLSSTERDAPAGVFSGVLIYLHLIALGPSLLQAGFLAAAFGLPIEVAFLIAEPRL